MQDKNYCDLVYSWLQCASELVCGERIIEKSKLCYSAMGEELGMDRRTVSRYVKQLIAMGLIEREECGDYKVLRLAAEKAALVPFNTLRQIVNSLHRNSVTIFVYLLERFVANG